MKVQYMSDLHLEFGDMFIPPAVGDVLVLAGDIHVGRKGVDWINEAAKSFKDVIYILGNHEFYNYDMPTLLAQLKEPEVFAPNVHFLDNESITIDGIKFAATTLWSAMEPSAFYAMNDSRLIRNGDHKLILADVLDKFAQNMDFLVDNCDADVVITHHCPHIKSINTNRYPDMSMNTGYYTDILGRFTNSRHLGGKSSSIKHWICGHTHSAISYTEQGIQVHNNCRGYVGYGKGPQKCEVENFNPSAYFEVC